MLGVGITSQVSINMNTNFTICGRAVGLHYHWLMFDFFVQTSGGCPPVVCLSMSSGSDWRWNICCGSLMASQLDSGRSVYTQGSPPKKPNSSPTQGLPWPLLARAFYLWPLGGHKVQEERTLSPTLCVCCTFPHDGMWGWQSRGPRGSREHPC